MQSLRDDGLTIVLVEHVMDAIRSLCDRCVVMSAGRKIADGPPAAVLADRDGDRRLYRGRRCLKLARIGAAYGKHLALVDIDLVVDGGEVVVMLGANGAGKSTLLKVIAGLVRLSPGRIDHPRRPRADDVAAARDRRGRRSPWCPRAAASSAT